jgi:hypothetical protein
MKKMSMSVAVVMAVAAFLASASPALAQKGKGNGKGGSAPPSPGNVLPLGNGKADPVRPIEPPNAGNLLPQSTLDKLPPGLRDKPENQPGLANHLRKLGDDRPTTDNWNPWSRRLPAPDQQAVRSLAQPKSGNSLPLELRDRLPAGLRDMPDNDPGLANYLRQMGVLKDYPAIDPVPPLVRSQLPTALRGLPYDHPGVANYLGRLGWSIGPDGALIIPPPTVTPSAPALVQPQPFQPLRSFLRGR